MSGIRVEDWPAEHARLVAQMQAVRPGLTEPQAHAALQALRTLRWVLHRDDVACVGPLAAAVCGQVTGGPWGEVLSCALDPHLDVWHEDGHGTRWRDDERSAA